MLISRSATVSRAAGPGGETLLSFSSEAAIKDISGMPPLVILHEEGAMDSSATHSVLLNHDANRIVGRIKSIWLDQGADRKGRASIAFDSDEESQTIRRKVESGSLQGVSVQFDAQKGVKVPRGKSWTSPEGRSLT